MTITAKSAFEKLFLYFMYVEVYSLKAKDARTTANFSTIIFCYDAEFHLE